jgi:ribosomal protein S6--L-glutamate ligase
MPMPGDPAGRRGGSSDTAAAPRANDGLAIAVLGEPGGWHVGRLLASIAARGHRGTVVRWPELAAEIVTTPASTAGGTARDRFFPAAIADADAVIVRSMPNGGLEEVIFRMDLLGRLAAMGTPVVNPPRALEIAIDKYLSLARLAAAGLPVPRTVVAQTPAAVLEAWRSLSGDCVAKPLFGSQGRGIVRLADQAAVDDLLAASGHGTEATVTYLQEFVPHAGWDVRVLVVGDRAFTIRRVAAAGDWRTNVALGGRPEPFDPPGEWVDLAARAARAVGADVAGVDILPASDGRLLVLEVNAVPGWRGLESATAANVGDAVVRHVETLVVLPGARPG